MNILYYYPNYDTYMFQWQKYHIFNELQEHNIQFEIINPLLYSSIEEANNEIIKKIKTGKYQLFMSSYSIDKLYIDTLQLMKHHNVASLCFCPDNLTVPYNQKDIAKYYDLVWITSKETEYLFKKWGAKTIFLPYAANPSLLKPIVPTEEIMRLAFIGTPHGSRVERLNMFLDNKIPLSVYSKISDTSNKRFRGTSRSYYSAISNYLKFPIGRRLLLGIVLDKLGRHELDLNSASLEMKEPVPLEEIGMVNSSYAIVLAFTEANSTGVLKKPVPIVNLRNFEIPMSGGLEFTTYIDELAMYFEPDKEIILCHSKEEMIDKARFYLREDNKGLRLKMKEAARKRAEHDHTWHRRFSSIFNELNIG